MIKKTIYRCHLIRVYMSKKIKRHMSTIKMTYICRLIFFRHIYHTFIFWVYICYIYVLGIYMSFKTTTYIYHRIFQMLLQLWTNNFGPR